MADHLDGIEMLSHDLARFGHLLGDDTEGDFLHASRTAVHQAWT
jgi:hypothetical protein